MRSSTLLAVAQLLLASSAYAQVDRVGNVLNAELNGYVSDSTLAIVFWCTVMGCIGGALYAKYKQSKGEEFAVDGGVIIGGFFGFVVLPLIYVLATK